MESIPGLLKCLQIQALAVDPDPGWLNETLKRENFQNCLVLKSRSVPSFVGFKGGFYCMLRLLSLKCSGFWSFSVHQKLGFGPVSTIRLNTAPDSANMDMRDCF